jgi:KilA-N domain
MANIILHQIGNTAVGLNAENGYVNATAMAAGHKERTGQRRDVAHWLANKRTQETIEHLSAVTGIPVTALYQVFQGGNEQDCQGTWIHPKLAVRFGMWLSDDFGLAVESWVEEWRSPKVGNPALPGNYIEALKALVSAEEQRALQSEQIKLLEADNLRQSEAIDELFEYSSILRIAKFNKCDEKAFSWHKLKAASRALSLEVKQVPCPRFETKNLYSHTAWRFVYPEYRLPETTTLVINAN